MKWFRDMFSEEAVIVPAPVETVAEYIPKKKKYYKKKKHEQARKAT